MNQNRVFQALWLLLLSLICVVLFFWKRERTKFPQEVIAETDTVALQPTDARVLPTSVPTPELTPVPTPMPSPTPAPTLYEIVDVFVPLFADPTSTPPATVPPDSVYAQETPFSPPKSAEPFSLIWFSDTQYYAYKRPEIFLSMADWAQHVHEIYHVAAVVCTGDIVDNRNYQRHWDNADAAISRIRESLPFYCVAGNHDVGADSVDYTAYRRADLCTAPDTMQFSEDGRCWVLPMPEQQILLCGIGWQNDTAYADWLNTAIAEYPQYPAVLLVHSFLNDDGTLSTNGKRIEQAVLAASPTIRLVLCGHNDGSARWSKSYPDGHTVNAMMYNFQDDKKYGLGYARVLMFNPGTRNIAVTTYSPYLDDYNYYKKTELDTFTLYDAW